MLLKSGTSAPLSSPRQSSQPQRVFVVWTGQRVGRSREIVDIGIIAADLVLLRGNGRSAGASRAAKMVKQGGSRRFTVMPNRTGV